MAIPSTSKTETHEVDETTPRRDPLVVTVANPLAQMAFDPERMRRNALEVARAVAKHSTRIESPSKRLGSEG